VTLFGRLTREVLKRPLASEIPQRILPVCARPPADLGALFEVEFADIKRMVAPGSRKRLDAKAKLRRAGLAQERAGATHPALAGGGHARSHIPGGRAGAVDFS
jgi:hypothetical protein